MIKNHFQNHIHHRAAILVIYFLLLAGALFALEDFVVQSSEHFGLYLTEHAIFGVFVFIALAAVSIIGGPFTSAPIIPSAVIAWGSAPAFFLMFVGWLLGNSAAYVIGYHFGYPVVHKLVSDEKFHQWISFMNKHINIEFLFLVRLSVPSEIGYLFGLIRYDFLKYLLITFFAELPFALLLVYAGSAFLENNWALLFSIGAVWGALLFVAFRAARRMSA